jgi:riboflavin kinase / FMN adenylyltransferase
VVSIGVFDGVHLGHQAILAENVRLARELELPATIVTFRRHPKRVLLGREPRTLTSLEHRLELFRRAGIEHTLVLTFDEELRTVEAEAFVREILIGKLGARAFALGFDSKFGKDRRGTPELLAGLGHDVRVVPQVLVGGRAVSSTAIREAVELGDLDTAQRMLGRWVSVLGTVVRGDGLGRQLGFPTANLDLHHELHPPVGVYAGWATPLDKEERAGKQASRGAAPRRSIRAVANIGVRPTLAREGPRDPRVEVHLLDGVPAEIASEGGDLYGRNLEFSFVARLRGEKRFAGPEQLTAQIAKDVRSARAALTASAPRSE